MSCYRDSMVCYASKGSSDLSICYSLEFSRIKKEVFYTQQCVYKCVNTQVLLIADDWMGKVNFLKEKTRNKSLY